MSGVRSAESPVYLIIGASGGIGSDLARRLDSRGARLILAGRNREELANLAASLDSRTLICNAVNFDQLNDCVTAAVAEYGRLDGVANCVGSILLKPAHLTSEDEWSSVIATNLTTAFATVRSASKAMFGNGGSIVLVSSVAARIGIANHEAIAAAKAGVEGLVRSAAATYAKRHIRVNCVAPGLVETKLSAKFTGNPAQLEAAEKLHPLGRIGKPSDVSALMDWLLGAESSWVTGQCFGVDGGMSSISRS